MTTRLYGVSSRGAALCAVALLLAAACSDGSAEAPASTAAPGTAMPDTASPDTAAADTAAPDTTADTLAPSSTPAVSEYDFSAVAEIVEQFVGDNGLNGAGLVVVDADEGIIGQLYVGEFAADRVSLVASSSKMITSGVLLRLQDQGLLDLDTPVGELVPWAGGNPGLTVAQMLSNSSGLVGLGPDPAYAPYLCQFIGTELEACATDVMATIADDADIVAPDTEFRYGGAQWQVAGAVAETVSGKTWAQLLDETYVQPCGVQSLGYNNHWVTLGGGGFDYPAAFDPSELAPTENPHMEGGAYLNPVDYATLLLMHLRDGVCDGGRVLSAEAVAEAHADRIAAAWDGSAGTDTGYGLGWWIDRPSGRISDAGAYGSVPWLDLGNGFGAYLVVEADSGTGNRLAATLYEPVEAAVLAGRASS